MSLLSSRKKAFGERRTNNTKRICASRDYTNDNRNRSNLVSNSSNNNSTNTNESIQRYHLSFLPHNNLLLLLPTNLL